MVQYNFWLKPSRYGIAARSHRLSPALLDMKGSQSSFAASEACQAKSYRRAATMSLSWVGYCAGRATQDAGLCDWLCATQLPGKDGRLGGPVSTPLDPQDNVCTAQSVLFPEFCWSAISRFPNILSHLCAGYDYDCDQLS